jgi:hypothetical protein
VSTSCQSVCWCRTTVLWCTHVQLSFHCMPVGLHLGICCLWNTTFILLSHFYHVTSNTVQFVHFTDNLFFGCIRKYHAKMLTLVKNLLPLLKYLKYVVFITCILVTIMIIITSLTVRLKHFNLQSFLLYRKKGTELIIFSQVYLWFWISYFCPWHYLIIPLWNIRKFLGLDIIFNMAGH